MADSPSDSARSKTVRVPWKLIAAATLGALILGGVAVRHLDYNKRLLFLADGMQMSVHMLCDAVEQGAVLTSAELPNFLAERLITPSISHLDIDKSGTIVDPWDQPLRFEWGEDERGVFASCVSAGPDRQQGTNDDIGIRRIGDVDEKLVNGVWTQR